MRSKAVQDDTQLLELVKLWGPLLLGEVTPRLAPVLQSLLGHALQQSLREVPGGAVLPPVLSRQVAGGMVENT